MRYKTEAECPSCYAVYKVEDFVICPNPNCEIKPETKTLTIIEEKR
jgi:hypothetical protein